MGHITDRRMTARIEGDFVVFLIGMRINRFWRADRWLSALFAMLRMLKELSRQEDSGLLGHRLRPGFRNQEVIQYWRSFEQLRAYARSEQAEHLRAWIDFNRKSVKSGAVGIWHETYLVRAGEYEAIYNNMPRYGLGEAASVAPASGRQNTAAGRLGRTDGDDAPVDEAGEAL